MYLHVKKNIFLFFLFKGIKKYNSCIILFYYIFNLYKIFCSFTLFLLPYQLNRSWKIIIMENGKDNVRVTACMQEDFFAVTPNRSGPSPLVPDHPPLADSRPSSPTPAVCPRPPPTLLHFRRWFAVN